MKTKEMIELKMRKVMDRRKEWLTQEKIWKDNQRIIKFKYLPFKFNQTPISYVNHKGIEF